MALVAHVDKRDEQDSATCVLDGGSHPKIATTGFVHFSEVREADMVSLAKAIRKRSPETFWREEAASPELLASIQMSLLQYEPLAPLHAQWIKASLPTR